MQDIPALGGRAGIDKKGCGVIVYVNGLLNAWGRWSNRDNDGGTGWPSCSSMFKDAPSGSVYGSKPPLGVGQASEECEVTDRAVHMLKGQDVRLFDLAVAFYKVGGTGPEIADRLGIAKRTMYDRLQHLHVKVQDNIYTIELERG